MGSKWVCVIIAYALLLINETTSFGRDFRQRNCVTPRWKCPNENITFWLYTGSDEVSSEIATQHPETISEGRFIENAPIKILIHDYDGNRDDSPNLEIRPEYFERGNYNVISVDYEPLALRPCHAEAAHNIPLVAKCTAHMVDTLVRNRNFSLDRFHVIGYGMGGQIAGSISKYLKSGTMDRVTGLDPAEPGSGNIDAMLDPKDARFVDVLYTNALESESSNQTGHADFYANGGKTQPGCGRSFGNRLSSCDHTRAAVIYAESINSRIGFHGKPCRFTYSTRGWDRYEVRRCDSETSGDSVLYGEHIDYKASGSYYFSTHDSSPYARGQY